MNKFFTLVLLIFSINIFSQELNEAYLQSLPDDVREDVLNKINERDQIDRPVYRNQSTMTEKPLDEIEDELQDLKAEFEKLLALADEESPDFKRFGDNIFNMMQSSFMPINEPNFDSSYVLDFGDTLELQLIGQRSIIEELPVKRDGSVNIPEIGKISVSGLSLEEVSKLIKSKVSSSYIGVEAFITLTNVRDIQILVTGNAFNPGIYTLNGNSNLLHALSMAGGINEFGSYRQIDLIRNDEVISSIDLYDVFIHGKSGFNKRLRSGDSILVRPYLKMVTLSGAVRRPAIFELKDGETFSDLLDYGNGLMDNADLSTLRIERPFKDSTVFVDIPNISESDSYELMSSDRINITAYERKTVTISGAINTPGKYVISQGETLYSLINKAGGYKDNAYPFASVLNNKRALELNEIAVEKLYTSFVQRLITKGDALFASDSLPFILDELKKAEISGRVMAEFDLDVLKANPKLDTTLDDGDEIIIPIKTEQIYIFGEVNNSGAIRYEPAKDISYYIEKSGGTLESSDINNIFIVHPNGEVDRSKSAKLSILSNRSNDSLIYPGSVIYVPREVKGRDVADLTSTFAAIVSSTATSLAALSILND